MSTTTRSAPRQRNRRRPQRWQQPLMQFPDGWEDEYGPVDEIPDQSPVIDSMLIEFVLKGQRAPTGTKSYRERLSRPERLELIRVGLRAPYRRTATDLAVVLHCSGNRILQLIAEATRPETTRPRWIRTSRRGRFEVGAQDRVVMSVLRGRPALRRGGFLQLREAA